MSRGKLREIESKAIPPNANVNSFPTFVILDRDDQEIRRVVGRQSDPMALMRELGLPKKKKGTTRRRSNTRTTRRRIR
jgi:hypothetical protein